MAQAAERSSGPVYRRFFGWLAGIEDGAILRTAFFVMLAGTLSVLYIDYRELGAAEPVPVTVPPLPLPPSLDPLNPGATPGPSVSSPVEALRAPLSITLEPGRILRLSGTIDPGAADRFSAELDARGEYIDTVALDSPGGSVTDALIIGALIRAHELSTSVAAGALCASSCPLVFAGGVERLASPTAVIGVHQIYAAAAPDSGGMPVLSGSLAMADAQKTTALITRHLIDLGVDAALWLHALETAPSDLYYLTPEEMVSLKLATKLADSGPEPTRSSEANS